MKLAFFYNLFFGGAKRVAYEQVKGLSQRNHTIDVYTTDKNIDLFDFELITNKVFRYTSLDIPIPQALKRVYSDYYSLYELKQLHKKIAADIEKKKYDLVIVHPDRLTQAPYILSFLKTPSVYYCQEPFRIAYEYGLRFQKNVGFIKSGYENIIRYLKKVEDRKNVRAATFTLASCYHIRERMIEAYDVYPKISYPGIDEKIFCIRNSEKRNQVFFVGERDILLEGLDLVEKAVQLLPKRLRPQVHVISWTKENGERLTDSELVDIYNQSLLTICPNRLETFGLIPLESMACGTPVIATKVSGHRETIVEGETGFLVDFDIEEIAEKMKILLENKTIRTKMGEQARMHIEKNWTWKKQIDNFECLSKKFISS